MLKIKADKMLDMITEMNNWNYKKDKIIEDLQSQIDQLKQQLVEKEKELAYMTKQAKKFNNEAQKYYEDAYCNSFQNQKAIVELEKVKEWLEPKYFDYEQINYLSKIIDQQIKELKGEKDVED